MKTFLAFATLILTANAAISCPGLAPDSATVLVSCALAERNTVLETCLGPEQVYYSYGTPGQAPDLTMSRPIREVHMEPWPGIGRTIWEEFTLLNQEYSYVVWYSIDRSPDVDSEVGPKISAGVAVYRNDSDRAVSRLNCRPETIETPGYSLPLYDAKVARGQSWSRETQSWIMGGG